MSILLTETAFIWNAYETFEVPTLYQTTKNHKNRGPPIPRKRKSYRPQPPNATQLTAMNVRHKDSSHLPVETLVPCAIKNTPSHAEAVRGKGRRGFGAFKICSHKAKKRFN